MPELIGCTRQYGVVYSHSKQTRWELWQIPVHSVFHCLTRPDADQLDVFGGKAVAGQVKALAYIPWSPHSNVPGMLKRQPGHSNSRSSMVLGSAGSFSTTSTAQRRQQYLRQ